MILSLLNFKILFKRFTDKISFNYNKLIRCPYFKLNYFSYILLILLTTISTFFYNYIFLDIILNFSLINKALTIPIFSCVFINILMVIVYGILCYQKRYIIKKFYKRIWLSFKIFGALFYHYILAFILINSLSMIVFNSTNLQKMLFFNGDFLIIMMFLPLTTLWCDLNKDKTEEAKTNSHENIPIVTRGEDSLGYTKISKSIIDKINAHKKNSEPLTIGIIGDWGCGKTSLMNLMIEDLKKKNNTRRYRCIYMDVTKYNNHQILYVHFFYEILKRLEKEVILPRLDNFLILNRFVEKLCWGIDFPALQNKLFRDPKIESYFNKISEIIKSLRVKFVVFIDEIDRLQIDQIEGVFQLVRLVKTNMNNIIIVISSDLSALENYSKDHFCKSIDE